MPPPRQQGAREHHNNKSNKKKKQKKKPKNPHRLYDVTRSAKLSTLRSVILEDPNDVFVWRKKFGLPLHAAIRRNDMEILEELLKHDPAKQVSFDDRSSIPLFLEAVAAGNLDVIKRIADLVGEEGTVRKFKEDQKNALHIAAEKQNAPVLQWLLENTKNDVDAVSKSGQNALQLAGLHTECTTYLLVHGATPHPLLLWDAAWTGRVEIARALFEHRCNSSIDVDVERANGMLGNATLTTTPLFVAAEKGHEEFAKLLLERGAQPNKTFATYNGEMTPLLVAARGGFSAIVAMLVDSGADIHAKAPCRYTCTAKETALHLAASSGNVETVRLLLSHGLLVSGGDVDCPWSPLHCAARQGSTEVMGALLDAGADVNGRDTRTHAVPIALAAQDNNLEAVRFLLANGATLKGSGALLMHLSSSERSLEMVELLMAEGADASEFAVDDDDSEADDDEDREIGWLPIHRAARTMGYVSPENEARQSEILKVLIQHGADVNEYTCEDTETTALLITMDGYDGSRDTSCSTVRTLLEAGANMEVEDEEGNTPLDIALNNDRFDLAELLLLHGASAKGLEYVPREYRTGYGEWKSRLTPQLVNIIQSCLTQDMYSDELYFFNESPQTVELLRVAELLIQNGIDVWATDDRGCTALHWATAKAIEPLIRAICCHGGDASVKDSSGTSALHLSTTSYEYEQHSFYGCVASPTPDRMKLLCATASDIDMRNAEGRTPLHCACGSHENVDCVEFLLQCGANINARVDSPDATPMLTVAIEADFYSDSMLDDLILQGAERNYSDSEGQTTLFRVAEVIGHWDGDPVEGPPAALLDCFGNFGFIV